MFFKNAKLILSHLKFTILSFNLVVEFLKSISMLTLKLSSYLCMDFNKNLQHLGFYYSFYKKNI
jgi:hypothetical protein